VETATQRYQNNGTAVNFGELLRCVVLDYDGRMLYLVMKNSKLELWRTIGVGRIYAASIKAKCSFSMTCSAREKLWRLG